MDFREFSGMINITQVNPDFLTYMPIIAMPTEAEKQRDRIGRMLPKCEVKLSEKQDTFLLKLPEMRVGDYVEVPLAELPELDFQLYRLWTQFDIDECLRSQDFSRAFSKVGELFSVIMNYAVKLSPTSTWFLEKVDEIRQKLPLEDIAQGLGADSYSISIFPLGLSFNFPVGPKRLIRLDVGPTTKSS
ncbi:MAG: hypothetical protein GY782_04880 [Gammaproteobacteria bacterium]|nr:hypothetical protein [Gammaproteobacteria bacterium]